MRKTFLFFITISVMMLTSCGTSRQIATSNQTAQQPQTSSLGEEVEKSPAEIYARDLNANTIRGFGTFNGLPGMPVEQLAANNARGELVSSLTSLVKTSIMTYYNQYGQSSADLEHLTSVLEGKTKANAETQTVAQELINGSRVAVSNTYKQPNGTMTSYVCVELAPSQVLESIRANHTFQELINKEAQMYIDFKSQEFEKSMEAAHEELKRLKANQ